MTGGDVIRALNRSGLSARLIGGRIYITPSHGLTSELRAMVQQNREALAASLERFGALNVIDPGAPGIPYDRWIRSLPVSAFRKDNQ